MRTPRLVNQCQLEWLSAAEQAVVDPEASCTNNERVLSMTKGVDSELQVPLVFEPMFDVRDDMGNVPPIGET